MVSMQRGCQDPKLQLNPQNCALFKLKPDDSVLPGLWIRGRLSAEHEAIQELLVLINTAQRYTCLHGNSSPYASQAALHFEIHFWLGCIS